MKSIIFSLAILVSFVFTSFFSLAQTGTTIKKGRIFTADGEKILFENLTTSDSSHRYQATSKNSFQEIPAANVVRIEQQTGSEAMKWGLICGLSGLAGSVLGVLQAQNDYGDGAVEVNVAPIIAGITGASALIGALVGSGKKKYKLVYSNPKFNSAWKQRINVDLALAVSKHSAGLLVRYRL